MNAPLPLQGLGVVVTRPQRAAEALAQELAREGARPFVFPALAIEPIAQSQQLDAAFARLATTDIAIFVSANAVEHGLDQARRRGPWPERTRIAAIGEATARALRNRGFGAVISPPEPYDSEALLALDEFKAMEGREVLVFRGKGGREALREGLEARGARVAYAECYRRVRPEADTAPLMRAWQRGEIQAVSVLSAETLENFMAMTGAGGERLAASTALIVPHANVAGHRLASSFARVVVAPSGEGALVRALGSLRVAP
jgi:uroporphyrinogen-III synthase